MNFYFIINSILNVDSLIWFVILGIIVGILVGLTGLGGGTLMTPLLILSGLPTVMAVGTDLVYSSVTKFFASFLYLKDKTIDFKIVILLLSGSIPGVLVGYYFSLIILSNFGESGFNLILITLLSILLISLSIVSLINELYKFVNRSAFDTEDDRKRIETIFNALERPHYEYTLEEKCAIYNSLM